MHGFHDRGSGGTIQEVSLGQLDPATDSPQYKHSWKEEPYVLTRKGGLRDLKPVGNPL